MAFDVETRELLMQTHPKAGGELDDMLFLQRRLLNVALRAAQEERAKQFAYVAAFVLDGRVRVKGFASREAIQPFIDQKGLGPDDYVLVDRPSDKKIYMT